MKIVIECQSPLLQKSLELFLEKYLTNSKRFDIVIRDRECLNDKRCFYIANTPKADLVKPFSKSQLILALEAYYTQLYGKDTVHTPDREPSEERIDFEILEKRIHYLTQEYQANILKAVKAFYEK